MNNGIKFIVGVLKSSTLEESWNILINNIINELKEKYYDKYNLLNDENKLERLIILDIVGPEIIKRWFNNNNNNNNNNEEYKPELLREPYVLTSVRNYMTIKMKNELILIFDEILLNLDNKEYVIIFKNDIKKVFNELQDHITIQYDENSIVELYDDIGTSLICLLKNHDILASMISTEFEIVKNNNHIKNDKEKNQNDVDLDEIEQLLNSYSSEDINEICKKILGTLLPESMRIIIWAYRYLYRSPTDTPVGIIYVREVSRLANLRKISITINDDIDSPTNNVIVNSVHSGIINSFAASIYLNQNQNEKIDNNVKDLSSPWFGKLERRSAVLVYAAYILNGTLNDRITMTSIMLMYAFPNEPPTSEKMLRLMKRIVGECLPSEHLNKNYSLASTSSDAWILLQQKDRELYDHLQDSEISIDIEFTSKSETPRSLQLLSSWLENCFIGFLPEHTVLLIWDQLALLGGTPTVYQKFLPQICCLLLQLLRDDLLKTHSDLKSQLLFSGKKLKTSTVANEIRDKILML